MLEVDSLAACERCGTFAIQAQLHGRWLCAACVERVLAQQRAELSAFVLLRDTLKLAPRVLPQALPLLYVATAMTLLQATTQAPLVPMALVGSAISFVSSVIADHLSVQAARGSGAVLLSLAFADLRARFTVVVRTQLLGFLRWAPLLLLGIVPGVLLLLSYLVAVPIALFEPNDHASTPLQESRERMAGLRWATFTAAAIMLIPTFVQTAILTSDAMAAVREGVPMPINAKTVALQLLSATSWGFIHVLRGVLYTRTRAQPSLPPRNAKP